MEAIPPIWGAGPAPSDVPQTLNDSLYAIISWQAGAVNLSLSPDGTLLAISYETSHYTEFSNIPRASRVLLHELMSRFG